MIYDDFKESESQLIIAKTELFGTNFSGYNNSAAKSEKQGHLYHIHIKYTQIHYQVIKFVTRN